jgi:hypothetical protein
MNYLPGLADELCLLVARIIWLLPVLNSQVTSYFSLEALLGFYLSPQ